VILPIPGLISSSASSCNTAIRILPQRGFERGELHDETPADFPHLLIAPILLSVMRTGPFERFQHLDAEPMARVCFSHMAGLRVANSL
jgi:hypothetical protein